MEENIRENGHPSILTGAHNQTVITTLQGGHTEFEGNVNVSQAM